MSRIYTSADQLIGHTPLLELTHLEKKYGLKARLLGKLEYPRRLREGSYRPCHDR
jgi:cysteine synthase A